MDKGFWDDYNNLSDEILSMPDYDQLGRKFHKEQEGGFVDNIYMVCLASEDELQMPYNGNPPMPEPYPSQIMRLLVDESPFGGQPVYLDRPAPDREINEAAERLGVDYLSDYPFKSMQSIVPQLDSVLSGNKNIYELSDFAEVLENLQWHGQMPKYKAILEREKPRCLQDFIDLSNQIDSYSFQPEIVSPYDYGEHEMLHMYKLDHTSHGMNHFDFAAFGRECMEQNYAQLTPYGLIQKVGMEQSLEPAQEPITPDMEMNM